MKIFSISFLEIFMKINTDIFEILGTTLMEMEGLIKKK